VTLAVIADLRRRFGLRDLEPTTETTMTEERMALIELVEKQADGDLAREMLAFAAERIMEAEVEARTGAVTGPSEAETFWTEFLRSLADRGLRGVKLVIADDHKGLRAAARRVFNATHQRCRIHWMRNALAHAPAKQRTAVAAMLRTIFAQETKVEAAT
jgi:hypothetical protein